MSVVGVSTHRASNIVDNYSFSEEFHGRGSKSRHESRVSYFVIVGSVYRRKCYRLLFSGALCSFIEQFMTTCCLIWYVVEIEL